MGHHRGVSGRRGHRHRIQGLGQRPDLIHLHQQRVRSAVGYPARQSLRVGHEEIVADELNSISHRVGEVNPPTPIIFGQRVFDTHQREISQERLVVAGHPLHRSIGALEGVRAVGEELRRRNVESESDVAAQRQTGRLDRPPNQLQRGAVVRQIRCETAFVTQTRRETF